MKRGFTIVEVLISLAIIVIIASVALSVFSRLANTTSLDKDAGTVLSYIEKARAMAINSVGAVEHGVKFEAGSIKVFSGTTYNVSNIEAEYDLSASATISDIDLSSGGSELYFDKLTGDASATGTTTITSTRDNTSKTIHIYATGVVEIQ